MVRVSCQTGGVYRLLTPITVPRGQRCSTAWYSLLYFRVAWRSHARAGQLLLWGLQQPPCYGFSLKLILWDPSTLLSPGLPLLPHRSPHSPHAHHRVVVAIAAPGSRATVAAADRRLLLRCFVARPGQFISLHHPRTLRHLHLWLTLSVGPHHKNLVKEDAPVRLPTKAEHTARIQRVQAVPHPWSSAGTAGAERRPNPAAAITIAATTAAAAATATATATAATSTNTTDPQHLNGAPLVACVPTTKSTVDYERVRPFERRTANGAADGG
mmetsp:Transcript_8517/g.18990  ORF Transcript_8517/g.18990 Transcript_8517/m.18990 type:complete len:270 (+) Transcript_8517:150-959(+)